MNRGVNRGFCSSIGLHRISLVRASGETFRRRVFDALEGTREACPLGEQFCWHPVLPDPAPPPRRAPRPDPPVVCPGFGFDKFAAKIRSHAEVDYAVIRDRRSDFQIAPVESKTRTHHGPVGSGRRTAGRRGGAGLGRTGRRWVDPARRQPSLLPSSESKTLS